MRKIRTVQDEKDEDGGAKAPRGRKRGRGTDLEGNGGHEKVGKKMKAGKTGGKLGEVEKQVKGEDEDVDVVEGGIKRGIEGGHEEEERGACAY